MTTDDTRQPTHVQIANLTGKPVEKIQEIDMLALHEDVTRYILPTPDLHTMIMSALTRSSQMPDNASKSRVWHDGRLYWYDSSGRAVSPIACLRAEQFSLVECVPDNYPCSLAMLPREILASKYDIADLYEGRDRTITGNVVLYRAQGAHTVTIMRYARARWYLTDDAVEEWHNDYTPGYPYATLCDRFSNLHISEESDPREEGHYVLASAYTEIEPELDNQEWYHPAVLAELEAQDWSNWNDPRRIVFWRTNDLNDLARTETALCVGMASRTNRNGDDTTTADYTSREYDVIMRDMAEMGC